MLRALLLLSFAFCLLPAQSPAPAPPMGWNSWDCYGTTVTEAEVKAQADYMARHLKKFGWRYIVVDIQWSDPKAKAHGYRDNADLAMDDQGRLIPAVNRFPSSAGGRGFKPLADYIHARGLKFGIHIMRGVPRRSPLAERIADMNSVCQWNTDMYGVDMSKPGAQDYYDSIVKMYAGWGVDYIKADDMLRPLHKPEVAALHQAIVKAGRPIVLSLSPGPARVEDAGFLQQNADLWRVSDDFWDRWIDLRHAFDFLARWAPFIKEGSWPDGDMLPLGRIGIRAERGDDRPTRFTPDEQQTLMTLWAIARSPLMFGGDLPSLDAATRALITNREVLGVNQHSRANREVFHRADIVAWTASTPEGKAKYLAVFNLNDKETTEASVTLAEAGLSGPARVRDLWRGLDLGRAATAHTVRLRPHASALFRLTPTVN